MAQISVWQTFAFLPPTPFPCGYFWDAEEIRHQEHLHRVSHAQFLYSHRTDSPEAMKVYRGFISEQNAWMTEQEELRERETQIAMKAHMDRASRWAEEWRRLESGEAVEDVLMTTGATLITKSPFRREHCVTCEDKDSISPDEDPTPKSISTLNLPESLIDWKQGRTLCKGFRKSGVNCVPGHFPSFGQVDGAAAARIQNSVPDPAVITQKLQQNLNRQILFEPSKQDSSHVETHPGRFIAKPIISFPPPGLGPPKKSRSENFDTSKLPSAMINFIRQDTGLAGGEVIKVCSHKRWTDSGDLLYEILWKPNDLNVPPLKIWVKAGDFMDANKKIILDEYHLRNKLGTVHWRSQPKKKLRTSGSLGVKEIKDALEERKRSLITRGKYDDRAAEFLGKCRWMMRDEWQQRGRGWAAAIEVAERWRKAWEDADEAEGQIAYNLEGEASFGATVGADENDNSCLKGMESKDAPYPAVVHIDGSPSFKELDGGHIADPVRNHDTQQILSDNHKVTRKDEEEWRNFFGGIDYSSPIMVDVTDSSTIGGLSETGGLAKTFPNAVETWRMSHPESLTPEVRNINRKKGEFINLLKQDRLTRKSIPEAASTPVSVHSVSEAGSYLAHERETFFSRLFIKDRCQNEMMDAATTAPYKPILQPSDLGMEAPGGFTRPPATVITPLDGETSEGYLESRDGMPQSYAITREEIGRCVGSTQDFVTVGAITRDVAIQTSPSTRSLVKMGIGESGISSTNTKNIGKQLDDDWRVRFLELFSRTPGLSNLLAGARAYTGSYDPIQATGYVRSPVTGISPFGGDGGPMSSLDVEEATATAGDSGGRTERRKGRGPKHKKHKGKLGADRNLSQDVASRQKVAIPQEPSWSEDEVSPVDDGAPPLRPGEVWIRPVPWSQDESLELEVAPTPEEVLTKEERALRKLKDGYEWAKARGKLLKSQKKGNGLTHEERKEYKELKKVLLRYRATRWFQWQVERLAEQQRMQQGMWGARPAPGPCGIS
ncbi:hypothetical protein L873DRAFT_1828190 [Choiromyces venosus 120613-1]|uniref:Uncharacterized protein n=1 Tax=Choiromyces venosus 120613-1 TaxID=1336337 RepID=A0A3N4JL91_9PEZI|nr:hypothetical protein L873DRAFT_1828190 [Choiromyces venosus 120613-1]